MQRPNSADEATRLGPGEARAVALDLVQPLPAMASLIADALGSILATPVDAPSDLPPFDNAAMDGYALDTARLERGADAWVAHDAMTIATGQRVPAGMDAVVPIERVIDVQDDGLRMHGPVRPGDHVRLRGEEIRLGERVFEPGARLTPPAIGLLAALGVPTVDIVRRPRVGLLVSGDELRGRAGRRAGPRGAGETINDANGPMLSALIGEAGGQVHRLVTVGDAPEAIEEALRALALVCDVILTSGGTSVGRRDHMMDVVAGLGRVVLRQLAMRPGRPTSLGTVGSVPVVMLPGNPLALLVGYEVLGRPMVRRLAGDPSPTRRQVRAELRTAQAPSGDRWHAVPVRLDAVGGHTIASATGTSGAGMLAGAARADGLAFIAPGDEPPREVLVERW